MRVRTAPAGVTLLAAALVAVGCGPLGPLPGTSRSAAGQTLLADADAAVADGRVREALPIYERVVTEHPRTPAAAEALHALVVLRLDPKSPARDRNGARASLSRLGTDYPDGRWAAEVRAWRMLSRRLDRCEVEAARRGADVQKLQETLDSLKDTDLDLEPGP